MTKTYFVNVATLEELRKQYKKLIKQYHPDNVGGSDEDMKAINAEYERLFKNLKRQTHTGNRRNRSGGRLSIYI